MTTSRKKTGVIEIVLNKHIIYAGEGGIKREDVYLFNWQKIGKLFVSNV